MIRVTSNAGRMTPALRAAILHEDAICYYCGSITPTEVDHVIPWSRGGSADVDNLVAACDWCNGEKSDMTPDEWQQLRKSRGQSWPPLPVYDCVGQWARSKTLDELTECAERMSGPDAGDYYYEIVRPQLYALRQQRTGSEQRDRAGGDPA